MKTILLVFLVAAAPAQPVKNEKVDLKIQLVNQKLETLNALIRPLQQEHAKHSAELKGLVDAACEDAKIKPDECQAKIEGDKVVLSKKPEAGSKK